VDVVYQGSYTDTYQGSVGTQWKGSASGDWLWETRFLAEYTGSGIKAGLGGTAVASQTAHSSYDYDILLDKPTHRSCTDGPVEMAPPDLSAVKPTGNLASAARNVGGYTRALVLSSPSTIDFKCAALGDGNHRLHEPDVVAVRAPSVDNLLGGKHFARSCWQVIDDDLTNPFPHHYSGRATIGVEFTYVPRSGLKAEARSLAASAGKDVDLNDAFREATSDSIDVPPGTDESRCR